MEYQSNPLLLLPSVLLKKLFNLLRTVEPYTLIISSYLQSCPNTTIRQVLQWVNLPRWSNYHSRLNNWTIWKTLGLSTVSTFLTWWISSRGTCNRSSNRNKLRPTTSTYSQAIKSLSTTQSAIALIICSLSRISQKHQRPTSSKNHFTSLRVWSKVVQLD